VLVVEDDPSYGPLIARMLERGGDFSATLATTAEQAAAVVAEREFPLAVCDIHLPGVSGLELIELLRAETPEIAIVIASGVSDTGVAGAATELGAYGYLIKPLDPNQLLVTVDNALHRRRLELVARRHEQELEATVAARTAELEEAIAELSRSRRETIARLMRALEMRDGDTGAHVDRIGALAESLSRWIGIDPERAQSIGLAARMHDIGKIGVPDRVLLKPGPLDPHERREIERHPLIGREILFGSDTELLQLATAIAATHHEWFDGSGYPFGVSGEEIPVEGRIAAIVDVFDALHSERCYRPALAPEEALAVMRAGRGTQFDPQLLDVFLGHYEEAIAILGIAPAVEA
jgi:response regulator RpfG family c-di-GMP phosphodiesterase